MINTTKTDLKKLSIIYCIFGILAAIFVIVTITFFIKLGKGYDRFFWDDPSSMLTYMRSEDYHNIAKDAEKFRTYIKKADETTLNCLAVGDYYNNKLMYEAFMQYNESRASKYKDAMNAAKNNLGSFAYSADNIDEEISQALKRASE